MKTYRTETHMHTSEVSSCGHLSASEMVARYHAAGYTTLFITDHFAPNFFEKTEAEGLSYEQAVDRFFAGYRAAKEAAEPLGMTVLPAAEITLHLPCLHFLVYGITPEFFLTAAPRAYLLTPEELYPIAKANGVFVVQAHPYREGSTPHPDGCDAFEIYNPNPRHFVAEDEPRSVAVAKETGKYMTSGSDAHRPEDVAGGGVETPFPIRSAQDYIDALTGGKTAIIYGGDNK